MLELCDEIGRRCAAGERVALCTVVGSRGSTPQERGAKMLVLASGQGLGTLGGGCVEAEVRRKALELISSGTGLVLTFRLDHDYGWDDGLICGGIMDIAVQVLSTPADAAPFAAIAARIRRHEPARFDFTLSQADGELHYVEDIEPPPELLIAGAGHVAQALAALAGPLGFDISVIDDRADFASPARFPSAGRLVVGEIESELARYPITPRTHIVIVTRGHRHDGRALGAVINSAAAYIGVIGSKRKIRRILQDLSDSGAERKRLERVHAPIGLAIGAVSVAEIAVSIAAELIAARRGRLGQAAVPMKLTQDELATWLDRASLA